MRSETGRPKEEIVVPEIYRQSQTVAEWYREGYLQASQGVSVPDEQLNRPGGLEWQAYVEGYRAGHRSEAEAWWR